MGGGGGALARAQAGGGGALALGGGGGALARAQAGTAGGGLGPSSSELSPTTIAFARDDIIMACVRRLAGAGVYWDRLRVSGRVRGATCAAPRKNRRRHIGASPSCRRRKLYHHTQRASERWAAATASGVPPMRSAARATPSCRRTGSQKAWLCSSAQQRGDAAPRGRQAAPAAWLHSKTTQQEIRVSSEAVRV